MPKPPKTLNNMEKHLTQAEREAREAAEVAVLPDRVRVELKPPKYVKADKTAKKYWASILERMEGLSLLDDLDAEILGVYCSMLSRRDATQEVFDSALAESKGLSGEDRIETVEKLGDLQTKLQTLEKTILTYADKLGLTPTGRAHLARKRAAAAAVSPDDDLFGD